MENLKIRVSDEKESKEAQELFFELGGTLGNGDRHAVLVPSIMGLAVIDGLINFVFNDVVFIDIKQCKEITLGELRDLVVLKRNDVGDATHKGSITDNVYYVSSDEEVYRFESSAWCFSTVIVADLKLIEKPMKEYLDPENGYKLNLTDRPFFDWIEIPEGANLAWKSDGKCVFFTTLEMGYRDAAVVWQRAQQPEELPFVDDEPSLNDQYAEIEQVRQEYKLKEGMNVNDYLNSLRCADTVNHPSHYASGEIECIDAMEAMLTPEQFIGYLRGNAFKYQWRYENKGGITDLEKAQWYLNKLISRIG